MNFSQPNIEQILRAQQVAVELLKARFPNLTVAETTKLAGDLVKAILVAVVE